MKRTVGICAVLSSLALAAVLLPAPPLGAQNCYECFGAYWWTPGQWGMGSSCAQAEANAINNAYNYAYSQCAYGVCAAGNEEIVTPCMWDGTQYKADARVQYGCWMYVCPDQQN